MTVPFIRNKVLYEKKDNMKFEKENRNVEFEYWHNPWVEMTTEEFEAINLSLEER